MVWSLDLQQGVIGELERVAHRIRLTVLVLNVYELIKCSVSPFVLQLLIGDHPLKNWPLEWH